MSANLKMNYMVNMSAGTKDERMEKFLNSSLERYGMIYAQNIYRVSAKKAYKNALPLEEFFFIRKWQTIYYLLRQQYSICGFLTY